MGSSRSAAHEPKPEISESDRALLFYDAYRRTCFRDALIASGQPISPEMLADLDLRQTPGKLPALRYRAKLSETETLATLKMEAMTQIEGGLSLKIQKLMTLNIASNRLSVAYSFFPDGEGTFVGTLAVQLNLSTPSAHESDSPFEIDGVILPNHPLLKPGHVSEARAFKLNDPQRGFVAVVETDHPVGMIWHPLQTISQSESGFDRNYQASTLWLLLPVKLNQGETENLGISLTIEDRRENARMP
jgi:hypothetical protein